MQIKSKYTDNTTHLQTPEWIVGLADFTDKESFGFRSGIENVFAGKTLRL